MLSDTGLAVFEEQRPRLFGIAYRMLGSAHDAEDAVQDAWLRWAGADRAAAESVPAFLTAVITRLCLNRLTSARARRETYPGPWLPEPVLTQHGPPAPRRAYPTCAVTRPGGLDGAGRAAPRRGPCGDLTALEAMLAADVTAWSDGGCELFPETCNSRCF